MVEQNDQLRWSLRFIIEGVGHMLPLRNYMVTTRYRVISLLPESDCMTRGNIRVTMWLLYSNWGWYLT